MITKVPNVSLIVQQTHTVRGVNGMVVNGRKSKFFLPHPGELQYFSWPARKAASSSAAVSNGPC